MAFASHQTARSHDCCTARVWSCSTTLAGLKAIVASFFPAVRAELRH